MKSAPPPFVLWIQIGPFELTKIGSIFDLRIGRLFVCGVNRTIHAYIQPKS